ncbi:asparagine-linked glycosylation protein [Mortierella polycephala]|uniref:GDP-Man:Man(3)GlcNAc(2)-PP-Dol alpha-1,2-mannosyltransferase n=1 Tax=Mortierella polycephala TaxID=41804 RepID=A0A9P6Q716_9FUNG|nr:asparagine-linked glycosylation protein [Mortierella polycephala]
MAETSWLQAIVLWFSVLFIATSIGLLALYTVFMSYFNAKITNGFLANRERVFKEQKNAKAGAKDNKEAAKEAGTSASAGIEQAKEDAPYIIAGFFHPYCNAGGGGERVLWTAIRDIQKKYPHVISVVYTGDTDVNKEQILDRVRNRFNIELDPSLVGFEFLQKRFWVEDAKWPRFTLIGQSIGSMILGWEALKCVVPDIWIDTMGYAFTYPAARIFGSCQVVAYVHYPTISSDMIGRVASRESGYNNAGEVASSPLYTNLKLFYYQCFAYLYAMVGAFAHVVMVNSSWTKGHIDSLWRIKSTVVYPPCDTEAFKDFPLSGRDRIVVSVAQFRPEKGHGLQLDAMAQLLKDHPEYCQKDGVTNPMAVQLVMVGSARNESDQARIQQLKDKAKNLGISANLQSWLARSKIGIHAMLDEHFGIGVVEYMSRVESVVHTRLTTHNLLTIHIIQAAGLIPVAHNSAGPKMDIVRPFNNQPTGYLATTPQEFADAIEKVLTADGSIVDMQLRARDSVQERFSEEVFGEKLQECMHEVLSREKVTIFGRKLIDEPEGGWLTEPKGGWPTEPKEGSPKEPKGGSPTEPKDRLLTEPEGGWLTEPEGGWRTEPAGDSE